jgi:hypothetical protein
MQTYLPVALAIAQGVSQAIGERQMASEQETQNKELRQNAIEARDNDLAVIEARRKEERDAASQKAQLTTKQALQEKSSAMAAYAQSGQSGLSVNALLSDYLRQSLDNEQIIKTNLSNVNSQLNRERVSVINTAKSRVNQSPAVYNPSFISTALKIGGDAYTTYEAVKPPKKPDPSTNK